MAQSKLADANEIRSESIECYPGIAILERGFVISVVIRTAAGTHTSSQPTVVMTHPYFQVYHDVSDQADENLVSRLFEVSPSIFRSLSYGTRGITRRSTRAADRGGC